MQLKALVIDDSRVMRNMVMGSLRRTALAEFEFVEAGDGAEGLEKFQAESIDIAFVDWNMPNMSGIDFVRKARSLETGPRVPIVMVTSEKTMAKMEEALDEAGADAFLSKPFTVEEMQQKLQKSVEKAEARKQGKAGILNKLFG
jgi:two-component system chemotaxis response regulator CheY